MVQHYGGKAKRKTGKKTRGKRGKRRTRKMSKGASDWNKHVMKVWGELKKTGASFKDALVEASRRKKSGQL